MTCKFIRYGLLFFTCLFFHQNLQAQQYQKLHRKAILVDTHNDVLINTMQGLNIATDLIGKTQSDLARFKEGGVDAQFFSVWCDERYGKGTAYNYANAEIDSLYSIIRHNPDKIMLVRTPAELNQAVKSKKLGALIGVEGGHMLEDDLTYLDNLFNRGVRYLTLTWNNSTSWATSAKDETAGTSPNPQKGLNALGKQIVKRMNELGMLVDLSHVGETTFWDAMATTTKPVLVSHSCVHHLTPHFRNLKDDQIKAIAKNGGVIHLNFFSGFLDKDFLTRQEQFLQKHQLEVDSLTKLKWAEFDIQSWLVKKYAPEVEALRPPFSALFDHLDYIVKLVGVDYVGLGSDFDGITSSPQQLDDVTAYPLITKELLARGYSKKDVQKILGGNFIRVFKANAS